MPRPGFDAFLRRAGEERLVVVLCLLTDLLIFWLMLNLATLTRLHTVHTLDLGDLQRDRIICLAIFALSAMISGAYNPGRLIDRFDSMYFAAIALFCTGIVEFLAIAVLPRELIAISRRELAISGALTLIPLVTWRFFAAGMLQIFHGLGRTFYVVGSPAEGARVAQWLKKSDEAVDAEFVDVHVLDAQVQKEGAAALDVQRRRDAIICCTGDNRETLLDLLEFCETRCKRTFFYPSVHDSFLFQHSSIKAVAGIPLIEVAKQNPTGPYVRMKRAVDFCVALVGLLLSAPISICAGIAIKLTSAGPVFYTQQRIGKDGRLFSIYKFRTMRIDAESISGPKWADKNDPRVTPVGRFLRKHRIDEIPQLLNVLKGDMSLVGPRPERPHFHDKFTADLPLFRRRLVVRPGLTSLSHVLGSYSSDPADRLRYDLIYIGSLSFFNDLKVMVSTIRVVLGAKGAQ